VDEWATPPSPMPSSMAFCSTRTASLSKASRFDVRSKTPKFVLLTGLLTARALLPVALEPHQPDHETKDRWRSSI